jgi:hypothetical protein
MASIPVLFLLLVSLLSNDGNAQGNNSHAIPVGSSLSSSSGNRSSWLSPSGHFAFGFYPQVDGFAIGIWLINQNNKTVTWTANRDDPPVSSNATLDLTKEGMLLRTGPISEKSISDKLMEPAVSAAMLDSGNFVLYNNDSDVIWQTFDFPTDTLLVGQTLPSDHRLVSSVSASDQSSGRFALSMQGDGNVVAYPVNSLFDTEDSYWASGTNDLVGYNLTLSPLGVLFLHEDNLDVRILANSSYPNTTNGTLIHRATFDADGIFRLYLHHFESDNSSGMLIGWSALPDQCEVKGFCGLNSYCSGMANEAECKCYPGFDFVNPSNEVPGLLQELH